MGSRRFQRKSLKESYYCALEFSSSIITLHFLPHEMKVIILAKRYAFVCLLSCGTKEPYLLGVGMVSVSFLAHRATPEGL